MQRLVALARGFPGHPSHPPLTDVAVGAYVVAAAMLFAGALGLEEEPMAHGGLIALSAGLLVTVPTAFTGLLDWVALPRGSRERRVATIHLVAMVAATALFAAAWLAQRPGYLDDEVRGLAAALAAGGLALLTGGGYLGGTLVYVHGYRVLGRVDESRPQPRNKES